MRRNVLIATAIIVVVAVGIAAVLFAHRSAVRTGAVTVPGQTIPASAQSAVKLLVSPSGRQALTPELDAYLPKGQLYPAGTMFTAWPGSWHQAGAYANVTGVLRVPGKPAIETEIGLVRRAGRWLVTFEASK